MKTKTYQGWLGECPYGFTSRTDTAREYPQSLAEKITEDWKTGEKVSLRYYITDAEVTLEQASEALIVKTFRGDLNADYFLAAYSEYTVMAWEEGLKIGGHSLIEELATFAGKYALIVVEESLQNDEHIRHGQLDRKTDTQKGVEP